MIIYYLIIIIIIITMKNTKIPCSNVSTESYTGKEQSPKRFGLSAEGFDINFEHIHKNTNLGMIYAKK